MKKLISMILVLTMVACSVAMFASCSDKVIYLGVQSGTTGQYFVDGDADWGFDGIAGYASKG